MSVVEDTCVCSLWDSWEYGPTDVRYCATCHRYWRGTTELWSVSKVLRATWPFKPDYSQADPAVLENARDRGVEVDTRFTAYLRGETAPMPPHGWRVDAKDLYGKLTKWWDSRPHVDHQAQVILADEHIAGCCDIVDDDWIFDLKCTYGIEPMYPIQLAGYAQLFQETYQRPCKGIGIIHVTKRFATPRIVKIDLDEALADWTALRHTYLMALRRNGNMGNSGGH